jgi:redox-sensitive bicupin YhaK (pirin superfamily)
VAGAVSGPSTTTELDLGGDTQPEPTVVEITNSREAEVGAFRVRRALPRRARRSVGAWCFIDHVGPAPVTERDGLNIAPHPHIGLQTVTWLLEGEALHRDSLGHEQVIRPGELNLMTAGRGIAHSEEATGGYRGALHGVQLWVAQPTATRDGAPAFAHHTELLQVEVAGGVATVLVGELAGAVSPARRDSDHVGVNLHLAAGRSTLPLRPDYEYGIVVFSGTIAVDDRPVDPGHLAYLGTGRDELTVAAADTARGLLVGGIPFDEPLLMWWNFVARTREEITTAYRAWRAGDDRFGSVGSPLPRITVGPPPWDAP